MQRLLQLRFTALARLLQTGRFLACFRQCRLGLHLAPRFRRQCRLGLDITLRCREILQKLSGQQPLSIDQTAFLEVGLDQGDAYHRLAAAFPATGPQVLLSRADGKPWSAQPKLYDVSVILPPVLSMAAFGVAAEGAAEPRTGNADGSPRPTQVVAAGSFMQRPAWLGLDGQRHPIPISTALCQGVAPCVVEARWHVLRGHARRSRGGLC